MKRLLLALGLCLCLLGAAHAAPGDLHPDGAYKAMTALGNTVYLLDGENRLFAFEAGGEVPQTPLDTLASSLDFLIPDGSKLFGWETETGILYEISLSEGALTQKAALETQDLWHADTPGLVVTFYSPVLQDGVLSVIVQGDETELVRYDESGARTREKLPGYGGSLARWKDGNLLLCAQTEDGVSALYTVSPNGRLALARTLTESAWGMAVQGDVLYLGIANRLEEYEGPKAQKGAPAAYLPLSPTAAQTVVTDNGYVALLTADEKCFLRNLDPAYRAERKLTINGSLDNVLAVDAAFSAAYPGVAIEYSQMYFQNPEEYHTYLAGRQGGIDIFHVVAAYDPWAYLRDKGYALDLSASETLMDTALAMYPGLQEAIFKDGALLGLPVSLGGKGIITIRQNDLQELYGFPQEALPRTLLDMPGFFERWAEDFAQEYTGATLMGNPESAAYAIREVFLQQYTAWYEAQGLPLDFDTPLFREGLDMFKSLLDIPGADGAEMRHLVDYSIGPLSSDRDDGSLLTPLPAGKEVPYLYPANPGILFINPNSENSDLALAYLEIVAQNLPDPEKIMIMPEWNDPIPNPRHEEEMAQLAQLLAQEQKELEQAEPSRRKLMEERVNDRQRQHDHAAAHGQWLVSPEWIAAYRELAANLFVAASPGFFDYDPDQPEVSANIQNLAGRYEAGQITQGQYISELNRIARMRELEGE